MADEPYIPKAPKQPPDFTAADSKWVLIEKYSAHMYLTAPRQMVDYERKAEDERMPSWVGYVNVYEKGGIGIGREYHFFGKEIRLKYWGMKDDKDEDGKDKPLYHDLAMLMPDNKWQVMPITEYEVETLAEFGQKADAKKVIDVHLSLFRRQPRTKLAGLTIKR